MDEIRFYYEYETNGFLSNFYGAAIVLDGYSWPTVEHYYQAQKTPDPEYAARVRMAVSPDEAKRLGNDPECVLRPDWSEYKVKVMRKALGAKFTQHPDLRAMLLSTGDAILMEDSKKDYFWGVGADGSGASMLGALLVELRDSLRRGDGGD